MCINNTKGLQRLYFYICASIAHYFTGWAGFKQNSFVIPTKKQITSIHNSMSLWATRSGSFSLKGSWKDFQFLLCKALLGCVSITSAALICRVCEQTVTQFFPGPSQQISGIFSLIVQLKRSDSRLTLEKWSQSQLPWKQTGPWR